MLPLATTRPTYLTQPALDLYPQTRPKCLDGLFEKDSFGGISVADIVRDDVDKGVSWALYQELVDVQELKLADVLLTHGTADTTIPIGFSDNLEGELKDAGTKVTYKKYKGATHSSVVAKATKAAIADAQRATEVARTCRLPAGVG